MATTRASAPIRSPSRTRTTSPGTSSAARTVVSIPSRITVDSSESDDCNASTSRSAPASRAKPSSALRTTIAAITAASSPSPIDAETIAATRSRADERVDQLACGDSHVRRPTGTDERVGADRGQAGLRLGRREADARVDLERGGDRVRLERMR